MSCMHVQWMVLHTKKKINGWFGQYQIKHLNTGLINLQLSRQHLIHSNIESPNIIKGPGLSGVPRTSQFSIRVSTLIKNQHESGSTVAGSVGSIVDGLSNRGSHECSFWHVPPAPQHAVLGKFE